jgi:hypothetical protein
VGRSISSREAVNDAPPVPPLVGLGEYGVPGPLLPNNGMEDGVPALVEDVIRDGVDSVAGKAGILASVGTDNACVVSSPFPGVLSIRKRSLGLGVREFGGTTSRVTEDNAWAPGDTIALLLVTMLSKGDIAMDGVLGTVAPNPRGLTCAAEPGDRRWGVYGDVRSTKLLAMLPSGGWEKGVTRGSSGELPRHTSSFCISFLLLSSARI